MCPGGDEAVVATNFLFLWRNPNNPQIKLCHVRNPITVAQDRFCTYWQLFLGALHTKIPASCPVQHFQLFWVRHCNLVLPSVLFIHATSLLMWRQYNQILYLCFVCIAQYNSYYYAICFHWKHTTPFIMWGHPNQILYVDCLYRTLLIPNIQPSAVFGSTPWHS